MINEGGAFRENCPPNPPAKAFDKILEKLLIESFSGGPGGRFFKKAPLAAGGKNSRTFS
jgi:hypothetical protein